MRVGDKYRILAAAVMGLRKDYKDGDIVEIVKVEGNTGWDKFGYIFPSVWVGTHLEPVAKRWTRQVIYEGDEVEVLDPVKLDFDGVSENEVLTVTRVGNGSYFVRNPYGYKGYHYFFENRHLRDGSIRKVSSNNTKHTNIEGFKSDVKTTLKRWRTSNQVSGTHYSDLVVEPNDYAVLNDLDPIQHNVIKYVTRAKSREDLDKAISQIERLKEYRFGRK